jgi:signal-transduction protein with cAMP-binding, CBS, and nucleotidyltransferase domain
MFQMKIKKLAVVEGKPLVGLLSLTDIARFQPQMRALSACMKENARNDEGVSARYMVVS